ncbi:MAG: hypothetical protein KDA97_00935 [Acidimicrobiales bacterium]|nr:hypothetical protein [Acidimicrobiales bacterium]
MDDLERQIRAWADAAAPEGAGDPVTTAEVQAMGGTGPEAVGPARPGRGRWLAVAAIVIAVAAVGASALLVARQGDEAEPLDVGGSTSTTGADPLAGPVRFEVLGVADGGRLPGRSRVAAARTPGELAELWADLGLPRGRMPAVDPGMDVVVAMTFDDDACPPTLQAFERDGTTVEPQFVEGSLACEQPLVQRTFVVALEWATVGDRFVLRLPAEPDRSEVRLDVARVPTEPEVEVTWELDETTVAAGEGLSGTVTVENRSGAPIEGTTCGPFFAIRLWGEGIVQDIARPACLSTFQIPEGTSSHEVIGLTTHVSCSEGADPSEGVVACAPGGALPDLPAGTYEALLDQATPWLVPPPDPIEVTIT